MPVEEHPARNPLSIVFGPNASIAGEGAVRKRHPDRGALPVPCRAVATMTRNHVGFHSPSSEHGKSAPHQIPESATTAI